MKILIGCDPEVFVKKDNVFVSAYNLIKGDKKNPTPVNNGAVQVDGMALEFNTTPAETEEEFIYNVTDVFNTLKLMVPEYQIEVVAVADFDPQYMKGLPKEALELGCDPDYNCWNHLPNPRPNGDRPFRTASGHIHIGWTNVEDPKKGEHFTECTEVVKQMDFFLGLSSLSWDSDVRRRELYGKGGAFRTKSYGVEYRTLSNQWLKSKELMGLVYRNAMEGMHRLIDGDALVDKYGDIQDIINSSNWKKAKKILDKEGINYA